MSQLLYLLHNSPVWIVEKWFQKIQFLFRDLIWKNGQARISLQMLQRPINEGGMAVPHPYSYYLAAQLQQLGGCATPGGVNESSKMMLQDVLHKSIV